MCWFGFKFTMILKTKIEIEKYNNETYEVSIWYAI